MKQISFEDKMKEVEQDNYDSKMAEMTLPKRGNCTIDETTATMDQEYFDELLEYSTSLPTGAFIGKRWKRNTNTIPQFECSNCHTKFEGWNPSELCPKCKNGKLVHILQPEHWQMMSYEKHDDPKQVRIVCREIIIK